MAADPIIVRFQAEGLDSFSQELVTSSKNLDKFGTSTDEATAGINEMNAAIVKSKEALATLKPGTDEFNRLTKEIQAAEIVAQSFTQETATLKTQLRETIVQVQNMSVQLSEMEKKGLQGTAAYKALSKEFSTVKSRAGELKDRIGDLNKETAQLGSDTRGIDKFIRTLNVGVSAVTGLQAASALLGSENENLQKTLVKLNAAMLLSNSIQQIGEEIAKADSIFSNAAAAAKKAWASATETLTGATVGLRVALGALGLAALAAIVYGIVEAFKALTLTTDELAASKIKLKEASDKQLENLDTELRYQKALGKSAKELAKIELDEKTKALKVTEEALRQQTKAVDALIKKSKEEVFGFQTVGKKKLEEQKAKLDELILSYKLQTALVAEAKEKFDAYGKAGEDAVNKISDAVEKAKRKNPRDFLTSLLIGGGSSIENYFQTTGGVIQARLDSITAIYDKAQKDRANAEQVVEDKRKKDAQDARNAAEQAAAADIRLAQETQQKRASYAQQALSYIDSLSNIVQGANQVRTQKEINALEEKKNLGIINEKQYQQELAKIKNDAAQKQHRADVINAFLGIPKAILQVITTTPFFAWPFAIPIAAALATANAAIVAASPVPKFRKGGDVGEVFKGSGFVRGRSHEKGGVNAELEGNEFVHRVEAVKHYGVQFMKDINNLKFPKAMTVSQKVKPVYNTVNNTMLGTELNFIGQYIKQGNEQTVTSNKLIKSLIEVSKTKNRNA